MVNVKRLDNLTTLYVVGMTLGTHHSAWTFILIIIYFIEGSAVLE